MHETAESFERGVRRVVIGQAVLAVIAAGFFVLTHGWQAGLAAMYGGAVTILGAVYLGYRIRRTAEVAKKNPTSGAIALYGGAIQRFLLMLAALAVGLIVLKLAPLPLLATFAVAHLGYITGAQGRP